jgi:hypothetical protein
MTASINVRNLDKYGRRPLARHFNIADTGRMIDEALWVAALTGGMAVLASWVTSQGNARAARVQAEASARVQHLSQIRETRRSAYLELIEQAHITGELYWRLGDVYAQLTDADAQMARIQQLRVELRDEFDPLMHCARVILVEGPRPVAEAGDAVRRAASDAKAALWRVSEGQVGARARFDEAHMGFRSCLDGFIEAARAAIDGS